MARARAPLAAGPAGGASSRAMPIRWDNATPLPAVAAAAMVAAIRAMQSRAEAAQEAWWAAVLDDPRVRPRKETHHSFVRLREHTAPTMVS
jgi:hypothetical protein